MIKTEWRVMTRTIHDGTTGARKRVYAVYRLRGQPANNRSDYHEFEKIYMTNKKKAQNMAARLNAAEKRRPVNAADNETD